MQKIILKWIKIIFSDLRTAIISITVVSVILGLGGIRLFYMNIWIYLTKTMQSPTPLYISIAMVLALGVCLYYIYQQIIKVQTLKPPESAKEEFTKCFGILWDENEQPHCDTHKNLLHSYRQYYSSDTTITKWGFTCPNCKNPIFIVAQNGKYITQEDAIKKLKNL